MRTWEADVIAAKAHKDQFDKNGVPYIEHARAVSAGLAAFSERVLVAGLLHDVVEDTPLTLEELSARGCPPEAVAA